MQTTSKRSPGSDTVSGHSCRGIRADYRGEALTGAIASGVVSAFTRLFLHGGWLQ
jgi:hypothetical protein